MLDLPLIRVRYAQGFAKTLSRLGASAGPSLYRSRLDEGLLNVRDGFMPVSQLYDFVEDAAEQSGIWHLGLEAGTAPREQHSDFSRVVAVAPTLYQSLQAVCANSKSEDATARFHVVNTGQYAWLCCGKTDATPEAVRQIELFRYGALLEIIRYAAGPEWLPPGLILQSTDDGRLRDVPLIRDVNVRFGTSQLAIAMPAELLSRSLHPGGARPRKPKNAAKEALSPKEPLPFEHAVKEIVKTHMLAHRFKVADAAASIGMSSRSLQRRLADRGLSHSALLEQTRIESARALLGEENIKLQEIATELGYQHSTHFSRAFKRVCGVSPRLYRSMQQH
jgi:AraC-like DNA-binding protein